MNEPLDQFAQLLETEHLLGDRIFAIGTGIANRLAPILAGQRNSTGFRSLSREEIPDTVTQAGALFVHLLNHFADPVHMLAEEAAADYAIGCGLPRSQAAWVFAQHEQARAYWNAITIAWKRMAGDDDGDRYYAATDFKCSTEAFVFLFTAHAVRENEEFYEQASKVIDPDTDKLVTDILQHAASDVAPYAGMVAKAEGLLGIPSPASAAA